MKIPSADLRELLQAALGEAVVVGEELGSGRGLTSHVFLANDRESGRQVVIKVLKPQLAAGVSAERFRREMTVMSRLQHPYIVPILATGEVAVPRKGRTDANRIPFFTMPFVDGDTLRARLNRVGPLSVGECIGIMRVVASALELAHAIGIVHRDIKPENILLAAGGATVTDFGIAKALTASAVGAEGSDGTKLTATGVPLGTPLYMAPEQAMADPATDHRADLYALGVVAYEMLAGQPPFKGLGPLALLAARLKDHPPSLDELRGDIPPALVALVTRCLAKDPGGRPQVASEVLRDLDELLAQTQTSTTNPVQPTSS